jgi:uncharacterized protein YcbX
VAHLERILIYPVKSLDGVSLPSVRLLRSGALEGDRRFALLDSQEKYVNGKRHADVHHLRSSFDVMTRTLHLRNGDGRRAGSFHVDHELARLQEWLAEFFGFPVQFRENPAAGFPDDTDSPGPTIISTATLGEVASWFAGLNIDQLRKRMRANLEIGGVPPFWEDQLFGPAGTALRFQIGEVEFDGINPCQRCVVPPRDPVSGETYPQFAKIFAKKREETLPPWAERSRFNHFYRLAINTCLPPRQGGKTIHRGDPIKIIGQQAKTLAATTAQTGL